MDYNLAFQKITKDISSIYEEFPLGTKIYVGKTINEEETNKRHYSEGKYYVTFLAKGKPSIISQLENDLIIFFKNSSKIPILNSKEGSAGNPMADKVYCCFDNAMKKDELKEDYDILGQNYLINID